MELKNVVVGMKVQHKAAPGFVGTVTVVSNRTADVVFGGDLNTLLIDDLKPHLTLPLEAGKRYVRRNGSVTEPLMSMVATTQFPWYDGINSLSVRGRIWSSGSMNPGDLIADYVLVEAQPEPATTTSEDDHNEAQMGEVSAHLLPKDAAERKKFPVFDGFLNYFPAACLLASRVSYEGNEQHNPGQPLHWARGKSTDQRSAAVRHLMEAAAESNAPRRAYLFAQALWRVAAECQLACEAAGGLAAMYPGKEGGK